ncbi:MAG: DUF3575 domain-containing protein [Muribaculaceae bacterium]
MASTAIAASAVVQDSVRIFFRQSRINLDMSLHGNDTALSAIRDRLSCQYPDSLFRLERLEVVGGASPEGSIAFNRWLSERRAEVLFNYFGQFEQLPDSMMTFTFVGRDWQGLIRLVEADANVPYRDEVLDMLREIVAHDGQSFDGLDAVTWLKQLRGGKPYLYMYHHLFPELRASQLRLWYATAWRLRKLSSTPSPLSTLRSPLMPSSPPSTLHTPLIPSSPLSALHSPLYIALKTNLLSDVLLIPHIGAEVYLGGNFSATANWFYGWWKTDRHHWYWRAYGGDLGVRYWFGKAAAAKPLTGHHIGVYAQAFTYDFEIGGKGQIAGRPGGSLWDKCHVGAGIEYGYSLPIRRRLNLDFSIGFGYVTGEYWEYKPVDDCYVWQATKHRHWWGPTKAEVSLVWLIGRGNVNRKGGAQ